MRKRISFLLFFPGALALSLALAPAGEEDLRHYVKEALADPKIFVMNPPAELRAYAELSPAELQKRQMEVMQNGSILFLYPNGIPFKLQTRRAFKENGPGKTWYPDGTLQSDEHFENEKLMQGRYYSSDGKLLAEVKDGRGEQIEFDMARPGEEAVVRRKSPYLDGLKHGRETVYRDFATGAVGMETEFRNGQKDGLEKAWMASGQLNSQSSYVKGKQDGDSTYWHDNGTIQFQAHYRGGSQVGNSCRYEKDGQKVEETFRDGETTLMETRWYPEGAMMVFKKYDPETHRVSEGVSFDRTGSVNGKIEAGEGTLVVAETSSLLRRDQFFLETYQKDGPSARTPLPLLRWNSATGDGSSIALKLTASDVPDFSELDSVIHPPDPNAKPLAVSFQLDQAQEIPAKIPLPLPADQWSGEIYSQTKVKGRSGTFQFTQIVYSKEPEGPQTTAVDIGKPDKSPQPMYFRGSPDKAITIGEQVFPSLARSLGGWSSPDGQWVLYEHPAALIHKNSPEAPWEITRTFDFRPAGLVLLGDKNLLVWGTKPTPTPQQGIPHVVEQCDDGKNWKVFPIPQVDFLTRIMVQNGVLIVSGVRLPKDGLAADQDWFELPQTHFLSNDAGRHFTEMIGPSFLQIGTVTATVLAPDGRKRAYVMDTSFRDPSFQIYLSEKPDAIPRSILSVGKNPELVWSENSEIIALRHGGSFFGYYDIAKNHSELGWTTESHEPLTKRQQEAAAAMDQKIRALLEGTR